MTITLESKIRHEYTLYDENGIVLEGQAPVYVAPPYYLL